eukprot:1179274-Prymnesium_polylepis.1
MQASAELLLWLCPTSSSHLWVTPPAPSSPPLVLDLRSPHGSNADKHPPAAEPEAKAVQS